MTKATPASIDFAENLKVSKKSFKAVQAQGELVNIPGSIRKDYPPEKIFEMFSPCLEILLSKIFFLFENVFEPFRFSHETLDHCEARPATDLDFLGENKNNYKSTKEWQWSHRGSISVLKDEATTLYP